MQQLDISVARKMIAAAQDHASSMELKATIVVLDGGGDVIAVERTDGAWPGGFDLAFGKAQTSRSFGAPSSFFIPLIQPGGALFGVNSVGAGRYVIIGGGLPVLSGGRCVGAVGVSGGSPQQDEQVAEAAITAFGPTH